jgi:hypothetical protein
LPDLGFKIESAQAVAHAAAPLLNFSLHISDAQSDSKQLIHAIALRCQVRIEPGRRKYTPGEQESLLDLFGAPPRWGQTLRTMLWAHAGIVVPPFTGSTLVELPVPCTTDFNLAAAKFFYALEDDQAPLCFLFSGTIFYAGEDQSMQIAQIPWEKESSFRLPVKIWKQMMEMYYPNMAWLCLRKDAFEKLYQYKSRRSLPTWEGAIESLLANVDEKVPG